MGNRASRGLARIIISATIIGPAIIGSAIIGSIMAPAARAQVSYEENVRAGLEFLFRDSRLSVGAVQVREDEHVLVIDGIKLFGPGGGEPRLTIGRVESRALDLEALKRDDYDPFRQPTVLSDVSLGGGRMQMKTLSMEGSNISALLTRLDEARQGARDPAKMAMLSRALLADLSVQRLSMSAVTVQAADTVLNMGQMTVEDLRPGDIGQLNVTELSMGGQGTDAPPLFSLDQVTLRNSNALTLILDGIARFHDIQPTQRRNQEVGRWVFHLFSLGELTLSGLRTDQGITLDRLRIGKWRNGEVDSLELAGLRQQTPGCQRRCLTLDSVILRQTNLPSLIARLPNLRESGPLNGDNVLLRQLLVQWQMQSVAMSGLSVRDTRHRVAFDALSLTEVGDGRLGAFTLEDFRFRRDGSERLVINLGEVSVRNTNLMTVAAGLGDMSDLSRNARGRKIMAALVDGFEAGRIGLANLSVDGGQAKVTFDQFSLEEWGDGRLQRFLLDGLVVIPKTALPTNFKLGRLVVADNSLPKVLSRFIDLGEAADRLRPERITARTLAILTDELQLAEITLEDMSFQGIPVAGGLDALVLRNLRQGAPDRLELDELTVIAGPAGRFVLDRLSVMTTQRQDGAPARVEIRLRDVELSSRVGPLADRMKQILGRGTAHLNAGAVLEWDWANRKFRVAPLTATLTDQIALNWSLGLGLPAPGTEERPLAMDLSTLDHQRMTVDDNGLVPRLMDIQAQRLGVDRAAMLQGLQPRLADILTGMVGGEAAAEATRQVLDFLGGGGRLTMTMEPRGAPLALGELDRLNREKKLPGVYKITISRE